MPKLHEFTAGRYVFECPGCRCFHQFTTAGEGVPHWQFNQDMEAPTVMPSILVDGRNPDRRCHLYIRNGRIQFLNDCHHKLAGRTVDMLDWDRL